MGSLWSGVESAEAAVRRRDDYATRPGHWREHQVPVRARHQRLLLRLRRPALAAHHDARPGHARVRGRGQSDAGEVQSRLKMAAEEDDRLRVVSVSVSWERW